MRIHVTGGVGDLAADMAKIPVKAAKDMAVVTARNVRQGNREAQRIARAKAGPHGSNYYKRLTSEMHSPFSGEYGPNDTVGGPPVGAGYRHGPPNNDLAESLDIQGPKFRKDVADLPDKWFW